MKTTKTELIMNILLHFFILFVILTCIFWFVIAKVETTAISKEIKRNINHAFIDIKKNIKEENKEILKKTIETSKPALNILKNIYSDPDQVVINSNKWLLESNILFCIIIFVIILTMLLTMLFVCKITDFPFLYILKENLILFLLIGCFEIYFFLNVGMKYIPTEPSAIINNFLGDIKNNLKS